MRNASKPSKLLIKAFGFATSVIASCSIAQADDYHYNNMLIGDRASGLGGAYVALADDPSGLFYNPAGTVYSSSANISANMNAYSFTRTEYKNALGGKSWVRTSSALVPNFFGITQPLGKGTLGFSYAVTDSLLEDQDQTFFDIPRAGSQFTINFNNQDTSNNIGPSYAYPVSNDLSIGLTIYGFYRRQEQIFNQSFELADVEQLNPDTNQLESLDHFHLENLYTTLSEYGIRPILGFMYSPATKVAIGATISKVFLLSTTYETQVTAASNFCTDTTTGDPILCDNPSFLRQTGSISGNRETPWQLNVGGTWFVNNRLLLTSSLWVYEAIHGTTRPLINAAGGIEYYVTGKWAVRLGGYTDMANTPKLKANATNIHNEHVDNIAGTMSVSHFTRTSSITLGAAGVYGRGKAQILGGTSSLQDVEYLGLTVFLSASNSF